MDKNYFEELNGINVNDKIEQKNGLNYLSWAYAWGELKKKYPDSTYTIYENDLGYCYHTDGKTCWVKTGVTVNGIEHIEYLPVMDYKNKSIPLANVTSFDVNKAIQRSLTKAVARHGLGLYIYAGEDLPEDEAKEESEEKSKPVSKKDIGEELIGDVKVETLSKMIRKDNISEEKLLKLYKVNALNEIKEKQFLNMTENWKKIKEKCAG